MFCFKPATIRNLFFSILLLFITIEIAIASVDTRVIPAGVEKELQSILAPYMDNQPIADGFIIKSIDLNQNNIIIVLENETLTTRMILKQPAARNKTYLSTTFEGSREGINAAGVLADMLVKAKFDPFKQNLNPVVKADPKRLKQYLAYKQVTPNGAVFFGICVLAFSFLLLKIFKKHKMPASVLLVLASLFFVLFAVELYLFFTAFSAPPVKLGDDCFPTNHLGYLKQTTIEGYPEITVWCSWGEKKAARQCESLNPDTQKYDHKILSLGDSFTEGLGVFNGDQWPEVLEKRLAKDNIRVINCGRSGLDSEGVIERYEKYGKNHQPDIVIYAYVLNDAPLMSYSLPDYADISFSDYTNPDDWAGLAYSNFALVRFMANRYRQKEVAESTEQMYLKSFSEKNSLRLKRHFKKIRDFSTELELHNIKFMVVIFPLFYKLDDYPFINIHKKIADELKTGKIEYLDLYETFKNMDANELIVHPLDLHPNKKAQKLTARAIQKKLEDLSWLK